MNTSVYDKTDKGREEIATRKYQLASRLRTFLVMIDGRLTMDQLLKNLGGMGLTQDSIDELLEQGYIIQVGGSAEAPAAAAARPAATHLRPGVRRPPVGTAAAAALAANTQPMDAHDDVPVLAEPVLRVVSSAASAAPNPALSTAPAAPVQTEAERFRHLYDFYNQTIKSVIGLRGIMLQLKVEKCSNVEDFRALRLPYLEAVLKAKGSEMAHSMRGRLDHLLGGKPEHEDFQLPGD